MAPGRRVAFLAFASLALVLSGCSSVMLVRNPKSRIYSDAVYESSKGFFFFGLVGPEYDVNVDEICLGKTVDQIETLYTGSDVVAGIVTLGIYAPRTLRLWCQL